MRLWNVLTGSQVSHTFAHRGNATSLPYTTSCHQLWSRRPHQDLGLQHRHQALLPSPRPGLWCKLKCHLRQPAGDQRPGCACFTDLNHGDLLQTVYLGKKSEAQPACQILLLNNTTIAYNFGSKLSRVYVLSVLETLD